jgi:hypothetical protein
MAGTPKDLEALWQRNKAMRKKALSGELSPQELQSLPPQLRLPPKLRGFGRRKDLRGPALVEYLMLQGGIWRDKRFDDCINALLEHEMIDPHTHEFTDRQGPEVDRDNEYQQARCLAEVRAQIKQVGSVRQAAMVVAAEWGLPGNSFVAVAQRLRDQLRLSKKRASKK